MQNVTVIDYGMGNLWSVKNALEYLNCNVTISNSPKKISQADTLILPGVGSFRLAMNKLSSLKLDEAIIESVKIKKKKILGICLGIQLMSNSSYEDGITSGLNLINQKTIKFKFNTQKLRVPHIGFNSVNIQENKNNLLYKNIKNNSDFYFVHSYYLPSTKINANIGMCKYGYEFIASYEKENIFATQFHPEKSQINGIKLLKNFLII